MATLRIKDFLNSDIKPFLAGAFLSRIMECEIDGVKHFYAYSSFKSSKIIYQDEFDFIAYSKQLVAALNKFSGFYNWTVHSVSKTAMELRFYVRNDIGMSKLMFYKAIYKKIMASSWVMEETINESKKDFIRGFMELRGSVDITAKLIAQDYFYDNRLELKKAQILTDLMNLPIKYANFNARNLQPQYVSGENKRNAQFRINVLYYASEIGFINKYKATVFERAYPHLAKDINSQGITYFTLNMPKSKNDDITFIRYLNFFTNNIYEKQLTNKAIAELRKELNFDSDYQTDKKKRNKSIITLFNQISEDRCAVCGTTKTFTNKNTGKQHFEIHHVISFHNSVEVDNIANLVKLCPTCHELLSKNKADKESQIKAILKILHDHIEIFEFTSAYLGIDDISELAEKIWSMLG